MESTPRESSKVAIAGWKGKGKKKKGRERKVSLKVEGGHALGVKPAGLIPEPRPEHHDAGAGSAPDLGGRQAASDSLCLELPVKLRCRLVIFGQKKKKNLVIGIG